MSERFDLIIVGGGMVGATLACALANSSLKVAVIEPYLPDSFDGHEPHDLRVSALNIASENILKNIGAWQGVINRRACVYNRLKTWEMSEQKASVLFDGSKTDNHLGYIVENRVIQLALLERMSQANNITLINQKTTNVDYKAGSSRVELANGEQITCTLLVGADGGNSAVRTAAGIDINRSDYQQNALVINIEIDLHQQDITWQQFTPSGPLAFLPLTNNNASLVWYNNAEKIKQLLTLDNDQLALAIAEKFPSSLPKINKIIAKAAFPLKRQHAKKYVLEGLALIGDAAHIINPLAGQGVNIGLLDAAQLAQTLLAENQDIGSLQVLSNYEKKRRYHNLLVMQVMDSFYHIFSNDITPLKFVRNIGLGVAGRFPFAKRKVMSFAMGMEGPLPLLAKNIEERH